MNDKPVNNVRLEEEGSMKWRIRNAEGHETRQRTVCLRAG